MNTRLVVVAALVVGIAIAIWQFAGHRGGGGPVAKDVSISAAAPKPIAAAPPPASAARIGEVTHDDDPRGGLRLEGQVIDEHDQPVAHARVAIDANPPRTFETEADGAFAFDGLIARDYRLEASADDGYAGPARLRLGPGAEPVTLRMHHGGVVEVVVTAADGGAPIRGAELELRSTITWRATTDGAGVATLRGVGAVWAPLATRASGFAPASTMVSTSGDPATPARIAVALAKGAAISGRVVDDGGKPVAGARVIASSASEPLAFVDARRDGVVTRADGTFAIAAVAAGTWRLTATEGLHAPATSAPLTVDGARDRTGVELVMGAGGVVRGVVHDRAGSAVAGAEVRAIVHGELPWREHRQAFTDADGTFAIAGLPRRALDVVAWHATGASAIVAADLATVREQRVTLTLDLTGAIEGVVVDSAGKPIGDAQVIAEPEWSGGPADRAAWAVRGVQEAVTDQAGGFRFGGLPDGSYRLRAARPGATEDARSLAAGVVAKPGGAPVRLIVPADGRVIGKVAFADGTAPRTFTIALGATSPKRFASSDGKFAIAATAGTHVITVAGPGFAEKRVHDVAITEGRDTDVGTITVTAGRSVSGRVLDDTGAPVAGAKVAAGMLLTGGGGELYIEDESIGAKSTETDARGEFAIIGFPPAAITVIAGKDGVGRSASVRVPPGSDSATLDLVLQRTTGLEGKVTRGGAPVADTVVIANPLGATSSNFFVATGPDGTFAFDALAPGAYVVYPMIGGGGGRPKDMYLRRVEVALGARAHVDLDATPGPITIEISVKADDGTPVAMAPVIAIQAVIDGATMEDLRDGSRLPISSKDVIPMYLRQAIGGAAEVTGARPGVHTVCAVPMTGRADDPSTLPMKCVPARLAPSPPKQQVEIVVPAAWLKPSP